MISWNPPINQSSVSSSTEHVIRLQQNWELSLKEYWNKHCFKILFTGLGENYDLEFLDWQKSLLNTTSSHLITYPHFVTRLLSYPDQIQIKSYPFPITRWCLNCQHTTGPQPFYLMDKDSYPLCVIVTRKVYDPSVKLKHKT